MECKTAHKRLTAFLDGELEPSVREVVKTHLNLCSTCSLEYERKKKMLKAAKVWAPRPLPQGFAEAVRERAECGELPRPADKRTIAIWPVLDILPRWSWQAAAACLILVVGLVVGHVVWPRHTVVEVPGEAPHGAEVDPVEQNTLEMLATLQKLKVIQGMRQGTEETIAEHNVVQLALGRAIGPELAGKVALHQEAEALLAAGQVDEAEAILGDLERDAAYPLATYAGLQRRFGQPVPGSDSVYAELLRPDVLASPERLYGAVRDHSVRFARTYTDALDAGLRPFDRIKLPESFWQERGDAGASDE